LINDGPPAADPLAVRELGVVLVGAGWISRRYAAALQRIAGVRLVAVASRSPERACALASEFGGQGAPFAALEELCADPRVDLVCINSPNYLHAPQGLTALRAGRAVLIEKPLCLALEQADALIAAAERAGVPLGYAENLCFAPHYRRARELVASGVLGRILSARQVERHGGPYAPWFFEPSEAGGGALMDLGCHGIGVLLWLLGAPRVAAVRAWLARLVHPGPLEDEAHVEIELADGLVLVSESGWTRASGMESRLDLVGTEASLSIDLLGPSGLRLQRRDGSWEELPPDELVRDGYVAELEHFTSCVRERRAPEVGGREGRVVLEVLLAAYASAACGGRLEIIPAERSA
jgi:predicted dehydrogenase